MGVKISNLPIASTTITGSEEIPLVQSGVTKVSTISALLPYLSAAGSMTPINVYTLTTDKIFTDLDTNKVFHFNTDVSILSAVFSPTLANGFNVALMNVGTNSLVLSTNPSVSLKARGNTVIDIYGGAFVYRDSDNFYAVGRL